MKTSSGLAILTCMTMLVGGVLSFNSAARESNVNSRLDKLLAERLEIVSKRVKAIEAAGAGSEIALGEAHLDLFNAQLETAETKAERIAILNQQLRILREAEAIALLKVDTGAGSVLEAFNATYGRLTVEIKLERERAAPRLDKLLSERLEILSKRVKVNEARYALGEGSEIALGEARLDLLNAQFETAETKAERIAILNQQLQILKEAEAQALKVDFVQGSQLDSLNATYGRLTVEIKLERERSAPRLDKLLSERLEILSRRVKANEARYATGEGSEIALVEAHLDLFNAQLETADTKAERIAILNQQLQILKEAEAQALLKVDAGAGSERDAFNATYGRLTAEITLERERSAP